MIFIIVAIIKFTTKMFVKFSLIIGNLTKLFYNEPKKNHIFWIVFFKITCIFKNNVRGAVLGYFFIFSFVDKKHGKLSNFPQIL